MTGLLRTAVNDLRLKRLVEVYQCPNCAKLIWKSKGRPDAVALEPVGGSDLIVRGARCSPLRPRGNAGSDMCEKCSELDMQISEHQRQIRLTTDMQEAERLQKLVRDLIDQKIGFHVRPAT